MDGTIFSPSGSGVFDRHHTLYDYHKQIDTLQLKSIRVLNSLILIANRIRRYTPTAMVMFKEEMSFFVEKELSFIYNQSE